MEDQKATPTPTPTELYVIFVQERRGYNHRYMPIFFNVSLNLAASLDLIGISAFQENDFLRVKTSTEERFFTYPLGIDRFIDVKDVVRLNLSNVPAALCDIISSYLPAWSECKSCSIIYRNDWENEKECIPCQKQNDWGNYY